MKLALLTDTHFGWKNDSLVFDNYFKRFYTDVFFPTLKERGIREIIHLGDLYDRRKYINYYTLHRCRTQFFNSLNGIRMHVIVGNHDTYFRDSNDVNSVRELCQWYPNVHIYEEPEEIEIGGLRMLFAPWMNPVNTAPALDFIKRSKAQVVMGHLELAGFHYDRNTLCEHGLDRALFKKFKQVFSGHFHTQSHDGNIRYLGSPYEMTFADYQDQRGFHIFDTQTLELEFIKNPYRMFFKLEYDDRDVTTHQALLAEDFTQYKSTQVRVSVTHKTDPYLYDRWLTRLEEVGPDNLQIVETFNLEVDETAEQQFGDFQSGDVIKSDTLTILNGYVDAITSEDLDKVRLKDIMRQLFVEAEKVSG